MKNDNDYFEPELVAASNWNRKLVPRQTDEWDFTGNHKHWINRGQLTGNGIWNDLIALVMLSAYILQHLLQGGRYKSENKVHTDKLPNEKKWWQPHFQLHDVQSLPAENWVSQHIVCCTVHLQKRMPHTKFWSVETFCERQIHWTFALFHITALCVWRMWPSGFGHGLWHRVLVMDCDIRFWSRTVTLPVLLIVWERPLDLFTFEPNFRGGALHSEAPN